MYFYAVFAWYFAVIGIVVLFYPDFHMATVYISYLGAPEHSPAYLVYNINVLIIGACIFPVYIFVSRALRKGLENPSQNGNESKSQSNVIIQMTHGSNALFVFLGFIGCLGFSLLGIYYQGIAETSLIGAEHGHRIATWMAFGGFGFSAFFLLVSFIFRLLLDPKRAFPTLKNFLAPFLVALLFALVPLTIEMWPVPELYKSDHFDEWFFMFTVVALLVITPLLVPSNYGRTHMQEQETPNKEN